MSVAMNQTVAANVEYNGKTFWLLAKVTSFNK